MPAKILPCIFWIQGWVGPTTNLYTAVKRKVTCSCREWKPTHHVCNQTLSSNRIYNVNQENIMFLHVAYLWKEFESSSDSFEMSRGICSKTYLWEVRGSVPLSSAD
jgi:hypothetical protein